MNGLPGIFSCALDALKFASPEGGSVTAVGADADIFLRAGYRVVDTDADVCICRGGAFEFARARKATCRKLILEPTRDFTLAASPYYRAADGKFSVLKRGAPPFAVALDPENIADPAALFGEILALDLGAFDFSFGAYMRGERVFDEPIKRVAELVTHLTDALKGKEKSFHDVRAILADGAATAAGIVRDYPLLPHCSGATQTYEALRMLYAAEDRKLGARGETEAVLGDCIIEYYLKNLSDGGFCFPPDNGRRIDSLCEYFKTDVRRACVYTAPVYSPQKLGLHEYRLKEFRAELTGLLLAVKARKIAARRVFKRLYPDDGFGLSALVDGADVGLCIALAPDVFAADGMLSYLKQAGKLDRYIV